jgi:hypothetical protein
MRADVTIGSRLPDYELSDQTGKRRKLSQLQGRDPMIVGEAAVGTGTSPAPGVRAVWEAGEKDTFYPYGKALGQVFAGDDR